MKYYPLAVLSLMAMLLISCNESKKDSEQVTKALDSLSVPYDEIKNVIRVDDSLGITMVIRDMHKWYITTGAVNDFDVYNEKPTDTLWIGIDTKAHKKRMQQLKETNFFTGEFLFNYDKIAKTIDNELKSGRAKYVVGDLPPFGNDAVPWINAQDWPDSYWTMMEVKNIKYSGDYATFVWNFNDPDNSENNNYLYECRFKKINGGWKIDWMQGFDYEPFVKGLFEKY